MQGIWEALGEKTTLILLCGSEREYPRATAPSHKDRHVTHKAMREAVSAWAEGKNNVRILSYDKYIHSDNDFLDTINHFVKKVYYELALDLSEIFNEGTEKSVQVKGKGALFLATLKQKLRAIKKKILRTFFFCIYINFHRK